jgi:hypothetical protein
MLRSVLVHDRVRNAPEWEFPARSDSFDGSVLDH